LEIGRPHIEDLLNARAGIEERENERVIATTTGGGAIRSVENGCDLSSLEILDETRTCTFERHGKDPLAELEVLGVIRGGESRERMNGGQASISRRCGVLPNLLEVGQEGEDGGWREIVEVEGDDVAAISLRQKPQEERDRITVAAHGVGAHASDPWQVVGEELPQRAGKRTWLGSHRRPREPAKIWRQCRAKRPLAAVATGSRKVR
jgi:hypothetical protein